MWKFWGAPLCYGREMAGESFQEKTATTDTTNCCFFFEVNNQPFLKKHQDFLIIK